MTSHLMQNKRQSGARPRSPTEFVLPSLLSALNSSPTTLLLISHCSQISALYMYVILLTCHRHSQLWACTPAVPSTWDSFSPDNCTAHTLISFRSLLKVIFSGRLSLIILFKTEALLKPWVTLPLFFSIEFITIYHILCFTHFLSPLKCRFQDGMAFCLFCALLYSPDPTIMPTI